MIYIILIGSMVVSFFILLNEISYGYLKEKLISEQKWDLNICCGYTDCGNVNADIIKHKNVKNFILLKDIYNLPFKKYQFNEVLCSHTVEHIENPKKFHDELKRIGKNVTYLVPPIWDIPAAFNIFEHRWIFLTLKKKHNQLPFHIKLPFASTYQKIFGQKVKA